MNISQCGRCGEPLPSWSRADRRTCSVRCRVACWRDVQRVQRAAPQPVGCLAGRASGDAPEPSQALHPDRHRTRFWRTRPNPQSDIDQQCVATLGGVCGRR